MKTNRGDYRGVKGKGVEMIRKAKALDKAKHGTLYFGLMSEYPCLPRGWGWCLSPCNYMQAFAPDGSKRLVTVADGEWPHCQLTMWKRAASSPPGKDWWDFEEKNPDRINCREAVKA